MKIIVKIQRIHFIALNYARWTWNNLTKFSNIPGYFSILLGHAIDIKFVAFAKYTGSQLNRRRTWRKVRSWFKLIEYHLWMGEDDVLKTRITWHVLNYAANSGKSVSILSLING